MEEEGDVTKVFWVMALLAAALAAAPANAGYVTDVNSLSPGTYAADFSNYSDLYVPAGATWNTSQFGTVTGAVGAGTPMLYGANAADLSAGIGVLENRAIFNASDITSGGSSAWLPISQQVTGLFYDLTLTGVTLTGTGVTSSLTLDFSPGTRNAPLFGSPGLAGAPAGSGGILQIYASNTLDFTADPKNGGSLNLGTGMHPASKSAETVNTTAPVSTGAWGPAQWVQGSGTASDTYATASQGSLWLEGEFVPLERIGFTPMDGNASTVFEETINLGSGTGTGVGDVYVTGGSEYSQISSLVGLTVTESLPMNSTTVLSTDQLGPTVSYFGAGYWPSDSGDPAGFTLSAVVAATPTPEPVSMIFFATGLVAVGGYVAKRRMLRKE